MQRWLRGISRMIMIKTMMMIMVRDGLGYKFDHLLSSISVMWS